MDYIKIPLYLSGPNATVDRTDSVTIGTAGSYGVHAFEVERGRNWDNLSIKATFYQKPDNGENTTTPSDEVIQISVVETGDGLIPIPNELFETETDEVGSTQPQTWVTFSGYDGENLKMNSLRLMLEISDTGPTYTTAFTPTPDIEEQLINAVKELRDAACECATQAGEYSFEAAKSATAAKASEQNAYNSEVNAASSELAAELSAQAAEASELNAKQSETIVDGLVQKAENLYEEGASKIEAVFEDSKEEVEAIFNEGATKVENIFNQSTAKIQELTDSAKDSSNKAEEYAKQAKDSADAAKTSQDAALASETNAKTSETNASKNASDAATSATNAGQSETNALGYANRASAQATAAAESQRDAASSRDAAATSANSARTYMLDAKDYRDDAQTAVESTIGYATQASGSASAAQTSASKAATSEKNAHSSEVNAASSATLSDRRATEAATSASNAASSAQDAADSLADMEDLVAHMPQINPENELWQTWNAEEGQYEDTGVLARGQGVAKGGQPGQVLVKNSVANYDTTWVDQMEAIDVPVYSLVKQDVAEDGFFATYYLTKNDVQAGEKINIPKDYLVREAELLEVAETDVPYSGAVIGDKYINFTINTQASDEDEKHIYLPVKDLVDTYLPGNGIDVTNDKVSIKLDDANSNGLSVDAVGLKLSLATTDKAGALSVEDKIKIDNAVNQTDIEEAINAAVEDLTNGTTELPYIKADGDVMSGPLTVPTLNADEVVITNEGTDTVAISNNPDTNNPKVWNNTTQAYNNLEVADPVNLQDAATKKYVDQAVENAKDPALTATVEGIVNGDTELPYIKKVDGTYSGTLSGTALSVNSAKVSNNIEIGGTRVNDVPDEAALSIENPSTHSRENLYVATPTQNEHAATKKYVDDKVTSVDVSAQVQPLAERVNAVEAKNAEQDTAIAELQTADEGFIKKSGDTMSGLLTLNQGLKNVNISDPSYETNLSANILSFKHDSTVEMLGMQGNKLKFTDSEAQNLVRVEVGTPVEINDAANKKYVDTALAEAKSYTDDAVSGIASDETIQQIQTDIDNIENGTTDLPYIKDSGDTVTGSYDFTGATLNIAEPTSNTNPATKSYVDTKIAGIGEGGEVVAYTNGNGITISAENVISVNVNTTNSNGLGVDINGLKLDLASSTTAGAMSSTDKIKLDAVPTIETVESSISEAINALGIDEVKQDITSLETSIDNIPVVSVSETNGSIKIDDVDTTVYTHPVHTEAQEGFYKVAVDTQGHVTATTPIIKEDITTLGIPAQDTTYTDATTTKSGLMSPTDKIALNTAVEDIVDIKEDYVPNGINNVAKGNPAVCEDSVEWPLQGMRVYGKSAQVSTTGAQLFDPEIIFATQIGLGLVSINTDGAILLNGAFDSSTRNFTVTLPAGDYCFSGGTDNERLILHKLFPTDMGFDGLVHLDNETTINCYIDNSNEYDNLIFYPMINAGSTALPYEPYTGGKPSPSPEYPQEIHSAGDEGEIDVGVIGENILNPDWINDTNNNTLFSCRGLKPGDYTISFVSTADWWTDNENNNTWFIHYYNKNDEEIGSTNITFADAAINVRSHGNFTVPQGTDKIRLNVYSSVTKASVTDLMLNIGLAVLPYEPYQSQSLTFQTLNGLPGIPVDSGGNFVDADGQEWICNYRDWARGVDVQNVGILENFNTVGDILHLENCESIQITVRDYITARYNNGDYGFCNNLLYKDVSQQPYTLNVWRNDYNDFSYLTARLPLGATQSDFSSVLSQSRIYVPILHPVETPIPADELAAYKALHTYDGTTIVTSDDDLPYIEFQYVTPNQTHLPYIKNSGDIVNGDYTFNGKVNVSQPTENTNVANKEYVDSAIATVTESINTFNDISTVKILEDYVLCYIFTEKSKPLGLRVLGNKWFTGVNDYNILTKAGENNVIIRFTNEDSSEYYDIQLPSDFALNGLTAKNSVIPENFDNTYRDIREHFLRTNAVKEYLVSDEYNFATGKYIKRIGVYEEYNGEELSTMYSTYKIQNREATMAQNGDTVFYVLDEPIITDIPEEVMEAYNNLYLYEGKTGVQILNSTADDYTGLAPIIIKYKNNTKTYNYPSGTWQYSDFSYPFVNSFENADYLFWNIETQAIGTSRLDIGGYLYFYTGGMPYSGSSRYEINCLENNGLNFSIRTGGENGIVKAANLIIADPINNNHAATKQYVDTKVSSIDISSQLQPLEEKVNNCVSKDGDEMSGALTVNNTLTATRVKGDMLTLENGSAAVDIIGNQDYAGLKFCEMNTEGGTFVQIQAADPLTDDDLTTKRYVDQQVSGAREKQEKLDSYSGAVYTIASMEPNKLYNLRAVDLPDITVTAFAPPEDDNYVSVYHMIFQSNSTPVNLTLPDSVIYPEDFVIETKHIYEINIVDNLLSYQSWPMA